MFVLALLGYFFGKQIKSIALLDSILTRKPYFQS